IIQTDVTNPRNNVTRYTFATNGYFSGGYTTSLTAALGKPEQQTSTYQYQNGGGILSATTDALNRNTTFDYDANGNVSKTTYLAGTPDAVFVSRIYDLKFGGIQTFIDPLNHTTQFSYDTSGNLVTVTNPLYPVTSATTMT